MSVYERWKAATIAQNATSSAEVDLGGNCDFLEVIIPTVGPAATLKLQVAEKPGGTFRDLGDSITTSSGVHNYHDVWVLGGWQYIKVVASASQSTADVSIRVRGGRY